MKSLLSIKYIEVGIKSPFTIYSTFNFGSLSNGKLLFIVCEFWANVAKLDPINNSKKIRIIKTIMI
jgi:hypothetical protein